jgi:hypothetical protein
VEVRGSDERYGARLCVDACLLQMTWLVSAAQACMQDVSDGAQRNWQHSLWLSVPGFCCGPSEVELQNEE